MTSDSAYDSGVTIDSVCDMIEDMYKCAMGRSSYIKMPTPINKTGPSMYMNFVETEPTYVPDLSPKKNKSIGSDNVCVSVVSRARFSTMPYTEAENVDVAPSRDSTIEAVDNMIQEISARGSVVDYAPDDEASSSSRTFMSDTSVAADSDMEDLDNDGLPPTRDETLRRYRGVLHRVEKIVVPEEIPAGRIDIEVPASRFGRRF